MAPLKYKYGKQFLNCQSRHVFDFETFQVCSDVAMFENFITPIKANAARVNQIRQHRKAVHDKCVKQGGICQQVESTKFLIATSICF